MGSVGPFFDLFVTSVEKERSFLRIWGQKDHASAKQVELLILQQHAVFENSRSVPAPTAVYIDLLCCARYKTDGSFYRARVLDVDLNKGSVSCLFIDYGNRENVPICELRLLDSQNVLLTIPAQATSFILSEVVGCWEPNLLTKVVDIIGYEIVKCMVVKTIGHRNDIHLLKLYHKSQDFSVLLASFGAALLPQDQFEVLVWNTLGVPASYSHMMTPNNYAMMNLFNQMGRSPMNMLPPHIGTTPNPIMTGMAMHPAGGPSVPVPVPVPVAHLGLSPPFGNVMKPPATSLKLADGSDGECRTIHKANQSLTSFSPIYLDDDSEHKVYIPFVDKGTFSFVVQLLANETELTKLSKALNNPTLSLSHLRHPYIPGTICVAKFTEDDTLYRAVITGVEAEKCIVYFVDFGNTDSVKCHDLYEIPSEFVYLKAMGIQFTLAGLTNVNCTDEMLQVFFDLVLEKEAVLKVVPPKCKELLAKQQAELFIDDTNVKELINLEILKKRPKTAKFSYRNVALPEAGSKVKVVVSYVKSLDNFYVQLSSQQNELDSMMATVQSHCSGPAKSMELVDIQPGAICCALFENDGQWYRGLITSAESDEINVLYVDYGNEELVKLENLKHPDENIVNKLRTQAVPCRLSDIENCSGELLYKFEDFVLEKPLMMHVISFNKEVPCVVVRLFDEHGQDICKQLLNKPVVSTPRYESSQSENIRAVRDSKVETSSTRSGNSTNTGVNARQNSSSSDCTRQDESSSRDRSNNSYSKDKRDVSSYGDKENDASYRGRRDDSSTNRDCKEGDAYKRSWEKDTHNHSKNHLQGHGTSQRSLSTSSVGHCDQTSEKHYQSRDRRGESRNGPCGKDSFEARASRSNIAVPKADSEDVWDDSPKTPSIQCMSVVIGIKKPISIVYSNNPSDFYVQERPTSASFDTLMEDMEIYRNGGEPLPASNRSVGNACVAMYDLDGSYYRANILEVCGGRAKVMFVDYGNMEMVELDNLRKIDAGLLAVAGQAIHCKLMGVPDSSWSDDKVAQFALLCDSESLEAEFVEVKNSVHYIILRDVATNVTINEGYGATPESLLSPRSIVNTVQPCPELQCGSQHVAKVCWFETPGRFYVQLKSAEDEFRRTMKNLQSDYKDKTPLSNPVIGQCVVAIFKSDGAFYRARIKVQKDSRYGLQFIDYGNRSLVEPVHIYGLEHQYSSLPAQAILCSLDGVQPLEGGNWAKNPDVAKCFDGELVCNVVQETKSDEASYVVRLSCNGQDLSEILISKGFASDVTPVPASVEVVEDYPEVTPGVDLQILEGQIVPAHLTSCSSFGDELRVHVSFEEKELLQLKQNMEKLTSEELVNLPSEMVRLGQKCIVFTQASEYKRAFIVNGKSTAGVCIKFMDQGGFEECPCDKIYILPSNLELVPPMAHEFAPRNINCEKDLEHLCGKKVVVSIESYHSDKQLLVGELLYSCDNALVSSLNQTSKQEARILMAMPILKRRLVVTIAHASGSNVWLHEVGQQEILSQLLDDIYELYENDGEPLTAVVGALCAAKSHDDSWYRAIIEEVSSEGALVRYVDYGNTETLPFSNLKELNNFREIPALAVQASLPIIADETLGDEVLNLAGDKEFLAVFAKQGGKWLVELLDGENEMSVKLIQSRKAQPIEMNPLPALVARVLDVGSRSPAVLSFVTSPSEFYIHLRCHSKKLDKLQADLQTLSHCMSSFEAFPDEGTKVMALFSEDGVWYRGQVMPNQVIHFIDFGNESVAQLCDLKFLPPEMALIPSLATKCSLVTPVNKRWSENASDKLSLYLDGGFVITVLSVCGETFVVSVINSDGAVVPDLLSQDGLVEDELDGGDHAQVIVTSVHTPGDFWVCFKNARQSLMHCALYLPSLFSDWSSAATCFFKDMVADGATVFEMVTLLPGDPTVVSLTVNGRNIDEEVIALCSQKTWQKATVDATVVFANSPGDFYIHLGRDTDAVDEMNNNLQKAEEFGPCSSSSGTICAALYDEDKLWYRAIILGENSSSYNVRFLDYGNVGICSELKALPPHLQKIPPLALHCCLPLPDGTTEWSSAACEKFLEMLESRFELELLSSEEPFIVNMVCDSLNVAHEMASLSGVEVCHVDNLIDALRNSMLTVPSPKGKNLIRNGLEETSTPAYGEPSELHSSIVEITANSTGVELSTDGLQVEGEDNFEQTGTVLPNILCENREILLDSDATVGAEKLSVNTVVRDSSTVTDIAPISGQESVMLSETASLDNSVRLVEDGTEMLTNLVNNCLKSEMISEGTDITEIMETEMPGNFRRNFTPEPSEVTESVKSIAPVLANSKLEDSIVDITPDVEIPVITLDDTLDEASSSGFQGLENSISSTQSSDTYCRAVAVDSKSPVVCGPNDFSSEIDPSNVCTENEARTMSVVSNAAPVDLIGRLESYNDVDCQVTSSEISSSSGLLCVNFASPDRDLSTIEEDEKEFVECLVRRSPDLLCGTCETSRSSAGNAVNEKAENASSGMETDILPDVTECKDNLTSDGHEVNSEVIVSLTAYPDERSCDLNVLGISHGLSVATTSDFNSELPDIHSVLQIGVPGSKLYIFDDCEEHSGNVIDVQTSC